MKNLKYISLLASLIFSGCFANSPGTELVEIVENPVPGTVTQPWVEPMYDTVKVPGQLDRTGTYYRLPHETVVEIRSDRYQFQQYPNTGRDEINRQKVKRAP